jgi:hypothetical protein
MTSLLFIRKYEFTIWMLKLVGRFERDAPGLGIQIRNIEGPVVERAFLTKEIQRQLIGEIPADSKARISLVEEESGSLRFSLQSMGGPAQSSGWVNHFIHDCA